MLGYRTVFCRCQIARAQTFAGKLATVQSSGLQKCRVTCVHIHDDCTSRSATKAKTTLATVSAGLYISDHFRILCCSELDAGTQEKIGWQNVLLPWKKGIRPTYCIHQCSDCDHFPCRRTCPSSLRRARSLDLRDLSCSVLKTSNLAPKAHSTSPEGESCRLCYESLFGQVVGMFAKHCISFYWGWFLSVVLGIVQVFLPPVIRGSTLAAPWAFGLRSLPWC